MRLTVCATGVEGAVTGGNPSRIPQPNSSAPDFIVSKLFNMNKLESSPVDLTPTQRESSWYSVVGCPGKFSTGVDAESSSPETAAPLIVFHEMPIRTGGVL
jgi:hypothetical protein